MSNYHTYEELRQLGEQVRDRAIRVSIDYESAQVVQMIHTEHANDPLVDGTGHVAPDPTITQDMIKSYAHEAYAGIPEFFTAFATPDPGRMQPAIDTFMRAAYALAPTKIIDGMLSQNLAKHTLDFSLPAGAWHPARSIETRLDEIRDRRLNAWQGRAEESFKFDYLPSLKAVVSPQSELAIVLATSLRAQKEAREASHSNIWDIGQSTLTVLDHLHACRPKDVSTALTVFVSAVSVILAVPTDGWSVRAGVGLGMAVKGFVDSFGSTTEAPVKTIGGHTVNAVISSMTEAIASLTTGVDQQEQAIGWFLGQVGPAITKDDITALPPKSVTDAAQHDINTLRGEFSPR
jgi:hypothetical protein